LFFTARTSGVLFGAIVLGGAGRAIGIEMNRELCDLQRSAVSAFDSSLRTSASAASTSASLSAASTDTEFAPPISIVHSNVSAALSSLNSADVIVCASNHYHQQHLHHRHHLHRHHHHHHQKHRHFINNTCNMNLIITITVI
jgi:hypothetical protein